MFLDNDNADNIAGNCKEQRQRNGNQHIWRKQDIRKGWNGVFYKRKHAFVKQENHDDAGNLLDEI